MTIPEFKLERYFAHWEFNAPYLLSASDCETMSVGELLNMANLPLSELAKLRLGYTESQADPRLRAAIAGFYSGVTADDVSVTNAPEEAIFLAMMALLSPGDRVVVQTPYQTLNLKTCLDFLMIHFYNTEPARHPAQASWLMRPCAFMSLYSQDPFPRVPADGPRQAGERSTVSALTFIVMVRLG